MKNKNHDDERFQLPDPQAQLGALGYAAIFIDYENVYYHMRSAYADIPELNDFVIDLLMSLQKRLEETFLVRSIISKAYADFERLRSTPQGSLYLMGVETHNVLGTEHKNAADMKLCIDAMEVLYTRPEIQTFVIFAGDRDYIPLIQHLKKQAKTVISVGFEGSFSGDLLLNVGRQNFIDAEGLFRKERLEKLEEMSKRFNDYVKAEQERLDQRERELLEKKQDDESKSLRLVTSAPEEPESSVKSLSGDIGSKAPSGENGKVGIESLRRDRQFHGSDPTEFNKPITDIDQDERACLDLILRQYGKHPEVYLTPFLRSFVFSA